MLKNSTLVFIKKHWKDKEDFDFVKENVETLIDKYKEKIEAGEFENMDHLFSSCGMFLSGFIDKINNHTTPDEKIRLYNCFAFALINELLKNSK